MKTRLFLLGLIALALSVLPARAQTDFYGVPKIVSLISTNLVGTTDFTGPTVDLAGFTGVGVVLFACSDTLDTNVFQARLEVSNDKTNWVALTNVSKAAITSIIMRNPLLSTNAQTTTNSVFVPGTLTTATPATDGFAGVYLSPAPFTSIAVLATNAISGTNTCVGIPLPLQQRYIHVTGATEATDVKGSVSAVFIGRKTSRGW